MNESNAFKGYLSKVQIQVTEEHIRNACRADSRHCMIADAIAAQFPGVRNISVDMMTIRWSDPEKGWRYNYLTPKPAQRALLDYDMGLEIKPFTFRVRSGHAIPMIIGSGKKRKRAHKVPEDKILKTTDKGGVIYSVGSKPVPMWPHDKDCAQRDAVPRKDESGKNLGGRPKEWHPSHNSLRQFGLRGFTEGYVKKTE